MKAIGVLGTASNVGKSWLVTALAAWLRRQGIRVAPFKAQNMSNNSYVTLEGGEIGRAQAVQAQACGLRPIVAMNPILLKPSQGKSQLVVLGSAQGHFTAVDYYAQIPELWQVVVDCLEFWRQECDVLLLEGAGSPVELNLMTRDIVNLRPIVYLQGKWLLVGDIERGGVFAQLIGTYYLLPARVQAEGLGVVVNKFRGDLRLFREAKDYFAQYIPTKYLGVIPFAKDLQPESEDSLCYDQEVGGNGEIIACVRFPYLSNSQDILPWRQDQGVKTVWVQSPNQLQNAKVIILPGTKDTIADLLWLRATNLDQAIMAAYQNGAVIIGICGGYQMLGQIISDPTGNGGVAGEIAGLGLLPVRTVFHKHKIVKQVEIEYKSDHWQAYEIHMGETYPLADMECLRECNQKIYTHNQRVWGTYIHGLFESPHLRTTIAHLAHLENYRAHPQPWQKQQAELYDRMASFIEYYLDLEPIWAYVENCH
ncbi:MAG: cobyric acid synthase [Pseudanabaenaceae cyanobacterium SKYGB_i_bin29]|nr:cobyric acid synthase [Pseudanabaenaceae cyanobacterium SKYG29]MDW8420424.1 cobyric acid synthase [Pseudanabaenaceae cyanobacterium SKYGB_i_bin29]